MGTRKERHKGKKKMPLAKKIFLFVLTIFLMLVIGGGVYAWSILSQIKQTDAIKPGTDDPNVDAIQVDEVEQKKRNVINIALFGLDRRDTSSSSRTDTIMIATIDKENKKIKLTSLMRDMYVEIPDKGKNRINAANALGGPGLAINTINENFDMDIKYYATVDFMGLQKIIEKLGGVDINVKQAEIQYLNAYLDELNRVDKSSKASHITKAGKQHLNGKQAVAYMRIRYVGHADYERTERQRNVLSQLFEKVKKAGVLKLPGIVSTALSYVETNMPKTEIISNGITAVSFSGGIEQYRLPVDKTYRSQSINGASVLVPDIAKNTDLLHKFIYGEDVQAASK